MRAPEEKYPLAWIDEYVANLREYVTVRETDNLLIKVPNEAHKLNPSAIKIMKELLAGGSILTIWEKNGREPAVRRDLYNFFISLKQILQGCVDEHNPPPAIESRPFSLDFGKLPILSEISLTYRCNLSCLFCYAGCTCKKTQSSHSDEMSTGEVKRILEIIHNDAEVPSVSFTGGEPTLRNDLEELISFARRELKMRVNLITNGTLIDERKAASLKEAGLNSAQVSLEAPTEHIHDSLTQIKGSFKKTVAAVNHLKQSDIIVHTNTTINRVNFNSVTDMPVFVKDLGLERFSMNLVIPSGSSKNEHREVNLRYSEVPDLIVQIQQAADAAGVEFMWYSPTPICIFNPIQHRLGNKGCSACDGLLSVSPTGDVLPCSSWSEPVGNLLVEGFSEVWESKMAKWLRDKTFATDLCRRCEDFALCQGACPLYWQYFGDDELKQYGVDYVTAAS